jgi:uroporphyrinogen-III synthase
VVVIGATTAAAAAELGLRCETADHPRIEDVIAAIVRVHAAPPG